MRLPRGAKTHLEEETAPHPDHFPENAAVDSMSETELHVSSKTQRKNNTETQPGGGAWAEGDRGRQRGGGQERMRKT